MSLLPRVTELIREQVAQDFDRLGPDACIAEIIEDLKQNNPEVLDMMSSRRTYFLASPWQPAI
jgi:hypothetical protein